MRDAVASQGEVWVVGDSMVGKGRAVNTGTGISEDRLPPGSPAGVSDSESNLPGQESASSPAEVRAAIVATKSGNADGAKGGRKGDPSSEGPREAPSASVPATDMQAEEGLWLRHKAQRGVWSGKMLIALDQGVKGAEQQRDRQ